MSYADEFNNNRRKRLALITIGIGMSILEELEEEEKRSVRKEPEKKKRRKPKYWVSPYLQDRNVKNQFATDFEKIRSTKLLFIEKFHMTPDVFDELYDILERQLMPKRNTRPQDFIPAKAKLAIVLEYLASGNFQCHLASCCMVSKQHFGRIVDDVCEAITAVLANEIPQWTEQMLTEVADDFQLQWNFPNCVGAIDGKHIGIKTSPRSPTYKGLNSLVLLATCDANYRFTYFDVGPYGNRGDPNVFKLPFLASVMNDTCVFPPNAIVDKKNLPHFLVTANVAFPLYKRIMTAFKSKYQDLSPEERIFNYRLNRAGRCIENAIGIMCAKWMCVRKMFLCSPERAEKMVSACCLLHNFLLRRSRQIYCPDTFSGYEDNNGNWISGEWLDDGGQIHGLAAYSGKNTEYGKYVRNGLKYYVNSANGSVAWQSRAAEMAELGS